MFDKGVIIAFSLYMNPVQMFENDLCSHWENYISLCVDYIVSEMNIVRNQILHIARKVHT